MGYFRSIAALSLLITQNIDNLGLVNGVMVEFYGFADRDGAPIRDEVITRQPTTWWSN
jgi:hypothetical protein